jgi:hypothetical protein
MLMPLPTIEERNKSASVETSKTRESRKLAQSFLRAERKLTTFRANRVNYMRHFAGPHYAGESLGGVGWRQPLNLVFSVVSTLEPAISFSKLMPDIVPLAGQPQWYAFVQKMVLARLLRKAKTNASIRAAARDTLYAMGITVTGRDDNGGVFFCDTVSPDRYAIDPRASLRQPGSYAWEGHRFRGSYERLMDGGRVTGKGRKRLEDAFNRRDQVAKDGAKAGAESILAQQDFPQEDEFDPQLELVQVYVPGRDAIVWLPGDLESEDGYILDEAWDGPEDGPYDCAGFHWLNDNPVPVPLIGCIFDLYLLENDLACKVAQQALEQRSIPVIDTQDPKMAGQLQDARQGQVLWGAGAKVTNAEFGGVNESTYGAVAWFHDWLSRLSGNSDIMGGMKAQSKTLGQDQILMANASVRLQDMKNVMVEMASSVIRKAAWFLWHDDTVSQTVNVPVARDLSLPHQWTPDQRIGEFDDYEIGLNASTSRQVPPQERYEKLMKFVTEYAVPMASIGLPMGQKLNLDLLSNILLRDLDVAEAEELWQEGEPVMPSAAPGAPGMAEQPAEPGMRPTYGRAPAPIEEMGEAAVGAEQ